MRIPQELVDAVIDIVGAGYTESFVIGQPLQFPSDHQVETRANLLSLALVSKACNHRARSHLFARCNFINAGSLHPECLEQGPGVLLAYTRYLAIVKDQNPATVHATLRHFISSPLITLALHSVHIPEELPEMLNSVFRTVRHVVVVASTLSPATLLNLVSNLERMSVLGFQRCRLNAALGEDDNFPSLPPLQGRLFLSGSDDSPPHLTLPSLLSRVHLPLRSLHHTSTALPSDNKLISACAGSLEELDVSVLVNWAESGFTLDVGPCINLQCISITFKCAQDEHVVRPLSRILLTLREHRLSNIQLTIPSRYAPDPQVRSPLDPEAWERLDQILYKLGGQAQGRGDALTFRCVSVVAPTGKALAGLLPQFNRIGACESIVPEP